MSCLSAGLDAEPSTISCRYNIHGVYTREHDRSSNLYGAKVNITQLKEVTEAGIDLFMVSDIQEQKQEQG